MKKVLLLLTLALLFAACSKSNNKPSLSPANATAANIAGKWKIAGDTTSQVQKSSIRPNSIAAPIEFIVYNANGTGNYINTDDVVTQNFTFTVTNAVIKMVINSSGGAASEQDLTILSVSASKMVVRGTQDGSFTDLGLVKQ